MCAESRLTFRYSRRQEPSDVEEEGDHKRVRPLPGKQSGIKGLKLHLMMILSSLVQNSQVH